MAFTTERITDMICRRLEEYGYDYGGHMSPKLYPIYLKVAGVIQIRLGLPKGFLKANMADQELFKKQSEGCRYAPFFFMRFSCVLRQKVLSAKYKMYLCATY